MCNDTLSSKSLPNTGASIAISDINPCHDGRFRSYLENKKANSGSFLGNFSSRCTNCHL